MTRNREDSAFAGWMLMLGFALFIAGGFAVDAGLKVGGSAVMIVGIMFILPAFR